MTTIGAALSLVDALGPASGRPAPAVATGESGFEAVFARVLEQPARFDQPTSSSAGEVERSRPHERSDDATPDAVGEVDADPSRTETTETTDTTDDASDTARRGGDEPSPSTVVPMAQLAASTQVPAPGVQLAPSLVGADAADDATAALPVIDAAATAVPAADAVAATGIAGVVPGAPVEPSTAPVPDPAGAVATAQTGPAAPLAATAAQTSTDPAATEALAAAAEASSAITVEQQQAAAEGQGSGTSDTAREGAPHASAPIVPLGEGTGAPADATAVAAAAPAAIDPGAAAAAVDAPAAPTAPVADVRPGVATAGATGSPAAASAGTDPSAQPDPLAQPALAGSRVRDRFVGNGLGGTMTVDLSDEGLGPLSLRAHQSGSGLHVTLAAADSATRELLLSQSMHLRNELESVGPVGSLDVTDTLSGGDGRGAPGDSRTGWADDRAANAGQRIRGDAPATDATLRPIPTDRRSALIPAAGSTGLDLLI